MLAGLGALQLAVLVATFFMAGLGTAAWHHLASLAVVLGLSAALHRPLRARGFLAVGVLTFTVLATVSGFYLLYWKEGIRIAGYQDWGVFWHVAWSWAAFVFFFQHTWVNRVTLVYFVRRSFRALTPGVLHAGLYVVGVVALWLTWGPLKDWFHVQNYIPLSLSTWLVVVVPVYAAWWWLRGGGYAVSWRVRRGVDLGLVPLSALAVLSGVPLLFFDDLMDRSGWKYVSKYWHVWPSVVFAVLVFIHSVQAWGTVRAHWNRMQTATPASNAARPTAAPLEQRNAPDPGAKKRGRAAGKRRTGAVRTRP